MSKINPATGTKTDYPTGTARSGVAYDGTNIWVTNYRDDHHDGRSHRPAHGKVDAMSIVADVPVRERAQRLFRDHSVLSAWVVSRLVVALGLAIGYGWRTGTASDDGFSVWDGRWYRLIALAGYGGPPRIGHQSAWPFFPLLPALMHLVHAAHLPEVAVIILANHALILVALIGVRRLADRHFGPDVARWSVWILAVFPLTAAFSMVYPSAIFLAASVWAFELTERKRFWAAGIAAAVATMARPNGVIVAVVLTAVTLTAELPEPVGRRRSLAIRQGAPSAIAIIGWVAICAWRTGNPLVFVTAKTAWHELTIIGFIGRLGDDIHFDSATIHITLGLIAAVALWVTWHHIPRSWRVLATIALIVPLATGLVGLGRYSNECFPLAIAGGITLTRAPRWARTTTLVTSTTTALAIAIAIASHGLVP